jgi:LmbE family N-acetylglucosaminyl deacetylase
MAKTVLVVAAHADDEALGCGGTIARHVNEGDKVFLHVMTNGVGAREDLQEAIIQRQLATQKAASVLGIEKIFFSDFPDNAMDSVALLNIIKAIEITINDIKPEIIYTHFSNDLNIDHEVTHRALMTACRPIVGHPVKAIYSFEVLSSSEWLMQEKNNFQPNYIVDISEFFDKKITALKAYESELRVSPHSRSLNCIDALNRLRGETHGFTYAEAFMVQRILKS